MMLSYKHLVLIPLLVIIVGLLGLYVVAYAFKPLAYLGKVVIHYKDGSVEDVTSNRLLSMFGMDIIDTRKGKAIDYIDIYLEVTVTYTGKVSKVKVEGTVKVAIEDVEGNQKTYNQSSFVKFDEHPVSGATTEFKILTIHADKLEKWLRDNGYVNGDYFKIVVYSLGKVKVSLLDSNGNVLDSKEADAGLIKIECRLDKNATITSLKIQFSTRVFYK